jgi:hypothetical protein
MTDKVWTKGQSNKITCLCDEWKRGMDEIIAAQTMHVLHGFGPYTTGPFRFCPWCGRQTVPACDHAADRCRCECHTNPSLSHLGCCHPCPGCGELIREDVAG